MGNLSYTTSRASILWFSIVSALLACWGAVFALFGLDVLPGLHILPVSPSVLLSWESAIYGAVLIGWGVTLLSIGRVALRRNDKDLMRGLLFGLTVWLSAEAVPSLYFGVLFNAGVDAAVLVLFAAPLARGITRGNGAGGSATSGTNAGSGSS